MLLSLNHPSSVIVCCRFLQCFDPPPVGNMILKLHVSQNFKKTCIWASWPQRSKKCNLECTYCNSKIATGDVILGKICIGCFWTGSTIGSIINRRIVEVMTQCIKVHMINWLIKCHCNNNIRNSLTRTTFINLLWFATMSTLSNYNR